jgi:LysM repeat protein
MNRSLRRIAIVTIGLLLLTVSLTACQRERPAAEEGAWTITPPSAATTAPLGTPQVLPGTTVVPLATVAPVSTLVGTPLATVVLVTPTPLPAIQPTGPTFGYVVTSGDTLFSIALANNTDVETIRRLNNLPDDTIQIGQVLIVPGTGEVQPGETPGVAQPTPTPSFIYTVQAGDSLSGIAEQFGVAWQEIAAANNISAPNYTIFPGQKLTIPVVTATPAPTAEVRKHIVQAGETLGSIAVQYGVTVQALLQANQLANPDLLRVGQELIIP